jgi:homoserine kinase
MLTRLGASKSARDPDREGLPLAGGFGGSAASSVAGALAAKLASAGDAEVPEAGSWSRAGGRGGGRGPAPRHVAPCLFGG